MAREIKTKAKKFALDDSPMIAENERILNQPASQPEQGRVEPVAAPQPTAPPAVQQSQAPAVAQPADQPLVYNEELKGISVKIPYSMYDALDAIKKRSQRTGNRRDKMGIGDLVVQAVKEFVEKTLPSPPVM